MDTITLTPRELLGDADCSEASHRPMPAIGKSRWQPLQADIEWVAEALGVALAREEP